jgi:molecular chaperone DnaK
MPQIEVTFDIDANGIVNVSAKDKATGKEQQIRIQSSGGLSEADIQRMVREAEQHANEDKRRREMIEARNQADALIYSTERNLKENGSGLNDVDRRAIEDAIGALRTAMASEDIALIRQRSEALAQVAIRIGDAVQRAGRGNTGPAGAGSGDESVVDAEFEDVEDPKRRAS